MNTYGLLASLKLKSIHGTLPDKVHSIEQDSRKVKQNSLFICIRGFRSDGHAFYSEALKKGATIIVAEEKLAIDHTKHALVIVKDTAKALAILANKYYNYPSKNMTVFGVTGTNGKTTVTTLINQLLQKNNQQAALLGTNGMQLLNESLESNNTTCDVLTNQKLLHKAANLGIDHMVMEVSSHGLDQGRLRGIDFDVVTFTNLTQDHLDYHKTMEHYGNTKGLLFAQLGNNLTQEKNAILNRDDPWYEVYNCMTPYEVISYGIYKDADFRATNITYHVDRTSFTLLSPEGEFTVTTKLIGEFNVYNTIASIASVYARGVISVSDLVTSLSDMDCINGRMQKLEIDAPITIYIDYAHTPDAIEKAIASVYPFKQNRILFVVGTGGDRDESKRPFMAEKASVADYVVLTINDSRYEDTSSILRDMEKGMQHNNYVLIENRKSAIVHVIEESEPGDIIIIAGKGLEEYQIIEGKKQPHSDKKIAVEKCAIKYNLNV
ncbi:UDP-N-acetylmuramoyl-L-alanyl-D-glutamate--2,6-diaminopimelate ligase [Oceanobacillus polygoni]|uniref:UDP-N-acetylmuramyl-tripeptide synthetase n=1 Tax=Oceanobacillus polygoni TaxID=1235259 RepID=A0A9X1CG83_9BACI|nr:UDP-N-acetylmuramoyl-L-alanyl-D-glutamate--2,6-diaminopimelate ligase [Oceanobacillus polygoni]MBP2078115.1 UDP-N-acetylmuramyl-tripeptide synthetase [Oceanobacillus polygoni]